MLPAHEAQRLLTESMGVGAPNPGQVVDQRRNAAAKVLMGNPETRQALKDHVRRTARKRRGQ
ncbi:hypothetical protein [Spongiactinospora gelatinilytica]|uniref:hypothetical protein n=1 Tax=Spongiactinospora gelatinilytica TaxID=2666298 RepID=UPI0011B94294|nr:hypothetical protein [Spongiactinospora gelatinilytica]